MPETLRVRRVRRLLTAAADPTRVHVAILALVVVFSLFAATRLWFFYDDWAFLIPSFEDPWLPHVGHWSTIPYLLFHALRDIFGLHAFLPFAIPVTVAHVTLVHLLWRFIRATGVNPWLATAASSLLAFFGAGSENFLWAFQVGFIGAMALVVGVILVLLRERLRPIDVVLVVVLSALAPMFSGTALPLLAIAAVVGSVRHGFARTALMLAPAGGLYATWYLLEGRFAPSAGRASGVGELLTNVPAYALAMLTDGFGRAFPVAVLGPLFFALVAIWGVVTVSRATRDQLPAYLLFLAAPVFALLTAYSRANLGIETATSSRYLYFVIPMMLPLMLLALDRARVAWKLPLPALVTLVGILALYNAGGLAGTLLQRASIVSMSEQRLAAALVVLDKDTDADIDPSARVYPRWTPDVGAADLDEMRARGWFTGAPYDEVAYLSAVLNLETHISTASVPARDRCDPIRPGDVPVLLPHDFVIATERDVTVTLTLARSSWVSDPREFEFGVGAHEVSVDTDAGRVRIESLDADALVCK